MSLVLKRFMDFMYLVAFKYLLEVVKDFIEESLNLMNCYPKLATEFVQLAKKKCYKNFRVCS